MNCEKKKIKISNIEEIVQDNVASTVFERRI